MFIGLIFVVALIVETPAFFIVSGPVIQGLVAIQAAVGLAVLSIKIPPGEGAHWSKLMRPAAILGLVPAIWMIVQAVPVPVEGWINSISKSAAAALDVPPAGSISIDPGMTLIALCHYLTAAAIVLMVAAVTIDRQRAERVLVALVVAATVIAAISLGYETLSWLGWIGHISPSMRGAMSDASVIGAILAVGAGFSAFERQQRTRDQASNRRRLWLDIAGCVLALALCSFAIIAVAGKGELFGAVCGIAVVTLIALIRLFALGWWEVTAIAVVSSGVAAWVIALHADSPISEWTIRFATMGATASGSTIERMMADAPMTGTGAGTFKALFPIYQTLGEASQAEPPTTAALIVVEMGRPALLVALIITSVFIGILVRGAMTRGRDAFYPAIGAGSLLALTIGVFQNVGLIHPAIIILSGSILGLGLAQSASRSIGN